MVATGIARAQPGAGLRSPVVGGVVGVLGALALLVFAHEMIVDPHATLPLFDLSAYQIAGQRVWHGVSLYGGPLIGSARGVFEFVYPPFAALLFVSLAPVSGAVLIALALLFGLVLLAGLVWLSLAGLGAHTSLVLDPATVALGLGLTGLSLWCEPVLETISFGQINLLVGALVLADALRPASARSKGALIGIAAGIKLTPLFFLLFLLVRRQFRAGAVAAGTFLATVLLGFVVLPSDSRTFWSGAFADPSRVGAIDHPGNQSLRGLIARGLGDGAGERLLWVVVAVVVAAAGLWSAARLAARGRELAAVVLCGMTGTAISPFSWVHHWVWFVPLLLLLLDRALRWGTPGRWLEFAAVGVMAAHGYFSLFGLLRGPLDAPPGDLPRVAYQHGYVLLSVLLIAAAGADRRAARGPRLTL